MKVIAYHGGSEPIRRFAYSRAAMGIFWFSTDKNYILRGESGASSTKYLMECELTVTKTAGRAEYERYMIAELKRDGYDSVDLGGVWIIFAPKQIKVLRSIPVVNAAELMGALPARATRRALRGSRTRTPRGTGF